MGSCNGVVLPVALIFFRVNSTLSGNVIEWQTALEIDNKKFVLESSPDAIDFKEIKSFQGTGNSTITKNYRFLDNSPFIPITFYRLKQIDFDEHVTYSNIISAKKYVDSGISIYPNPVGNNDEIIVSVESENDYTVRILSPTLTIDQKRVYLFKGLNRISAKNFGLQTSGIYFIEIASIDELTNSMVIVIKE